MKPAPRVFLTTFIGFLAGVGATLLILWLSAPSLMILEDVSPNDYPNTVAQLEKSVVNAEWKIATTHDLQATMKKFNIEVAPVKVFEICQPDHASKILNQSEERIVSSLMPCRIAVYEKKDGKTYISRMNTKLMGKMMDGIVPEVMAVASEESERIISETLVKASNDPIAE